MSGAFAREEVAIVGGGPAGASLACRLASAGMAPLLIEREASARHKICGEFLSIEAQADLADLGLDLARCGASRIATVRLVHGRSLAQADLPFAAWGFSRRALDEELLGRATQAGARLLRGAVVRAVAAEGPVLRIESADLGAVRTSTLVVATGKHDLRGARRATAGISGDLIGFKMYFSLSARQRRALEGAIEVILFADGYAGLQLVEGGEANLCLLVTRSGFARRGKTWEALFDHLLKTCPHLADRLDGAMARFERPLAISRVPYGFIHAPDPAEPPGLFRLGDQAGVIPSFTGDGIAIALHSARAAAAAILSGEPSLHYHRRVRRDIRRPIQLASLLYQLTRRPETRATLVQACQSWPALMRLVTAWTRLPGRAAAER